MNVQKEISRINDRELDLRVQGKTTGSWHDAFKASPFVFIGGLEYTLTEGDIIVAFSQWGEIFHCNLIRDKETGKSKGFCFIGYEDQRSTVLAVDNMNGTRIAGRNVTVDHKLDYKPPEEEEEDEKKKGKKDAEKTGRKRSRSESSASSDSELEDPLARAKKNQDKEKAERKKKKREELEKEARKRAMQFAFSQTSSARTVEEAMKIELKLLKKERKEAKKAKKAAKKRRLEEAKLPPAPTPSIPEPPLPLPDANKEKSWWKEDDREAQARDQQANLWKQDDRFAKQPMEQRGRSGPGTGPFVQRPSGQTAPGPVAHRPPEIKAEVKSEARSGAPFRGVSPPRRQSRSPPRRARSPPHRSRSPPRHDQSPPRRDRSMPRRSRSPPRRRSRSPDRRPRSPARRRSRSPRRY